ncbi:MAG: hypothetical protein KJ052_21100, partial [Candidatus Hydrogenedentes bacterium]|nr:hypothetical protein [Candidatus Hydrogenedentota bacterium]
GAFTRALLYTVRLEAVLRKNMDVVSTALAPLLAQTRSMVVARDPTREWWLDETLPERYGAWMRQIDPIPAVLAALEETPVQIFLRSLLGRLSKTREKTASYEPAWVYAHSAEAGAMRATLSGQPSVVVWILVLSDTEVALTFEEPGGAEPSRFATGHIEFKTFGGEISRYEISQGQANVDVAGAALKDGGTLTVYDESGESLGEVTLEADAL